MKKLLPLLVIVTLLGCNGSSVSSSKSQQPSPVSTISKGGSFFDFTGDGIHFVSLADSRSTSDWKTIQRSPDIANSCMALAVSSDSSKVAIGTRAGQITIYSIPNWVTLSDFQAHSAVIKALAFIDKDEALVSTSYDRTTKRWNSETSNALPGGFEDPGDETDLIQAQFSPSGRLRAAYFMKDRAQEVGNSIVFQHESIRIDIHQVSDGTLVRSISLNPKMTIGSLEFTPDEKKLLVGSDPGIHVWTIADEDPSEIVSTAGNKGVSSLRFIPDSDLLAASYLNASNGNGIIELMTWTDRARVGTFVAHSRGCTSLRVSSNGQLLASSGIGENGKNVDIRIWKREEAMDKLFKGLPPRQ